MKLTPAERAREVRRLTKIVGAYSRLPTDQLVAQIESLLEPAVVKCCAVCGSPAGTTCQPWCGVEPSSGSAILASPSIKGMT